MNNYIISFIALCYHWVLMTSLSQAKRGDIVDFKLIEHKSYADVKALLDAITLEAMTDLEIQIYDKTLNKNQNDIQHYKLTFNTIDPLGNEMASTATLIVPFTYSADTLLYNIEDPYGVAAHALEGQKFCTPESYKLYSCNAVNVFECCNYDTNIVTRLLMYATSGFAVVAPDLLGSSHKFPVAAGLKSPPFSQTRVFESLSIDVLTAYKNFVSKLQDFEHTSRLVLAGFGQGAAGALNLHRLFETETDSNLYANPDMNMIASFPQSGPFDYQLYAKDKILKAFKYKMILLPNGTATTTVDTSYNASLLTGTDANTRAENVLLAVRILLSNLEWDTDADSLLSKVFVTNHIDYLVIRSNIVSRTSCLTTAAGGDSKIKGCENFQRSLLSYQNWIKKDIIQDINDDHWPKWLIDAVLTRNQRTYDTWSEKRKASMSFCAATSDTSISNAHSKNVYGIMNKKKTDTIVTLDQVPGSHVVAFFNCHLILVSVLHETDWITEEKIYVSGKAAIKETIPVEPIPVFTIIVAIVGGCFFLTYCSVSVYEFAYPNRKKCPRPLSIWVFLLTKCSFIILILGLGIAISISIVGLSSSNWSLTIDSDFAGYMTADSALKMEEDMLAGARADQLNTQSSKKRRQRFLEEVNMEDNTDKFSRFLTESNNDTKVTQSRTWIELDIFYEALTPNKETGVFYKEALEEIKGFEERLKKMKDYENFCLKRYKHKGYQCDLPNSPINFLYAPVSLVGGNTILSQNNGTGELRPIKSVLKDIASKKVYWYTDKYFTSLNLTSQVTKSRFAFGLPLKGFENGPHVSPKQLDMYKKFMGSLYDDFFIKENANLKHIQVTWYEPRNLVGYEVDTQLIHDAYFSLGSFVFVAIFVLLHLESVFLASMAMLSIILSFPMAYFVFYVIVGVKKMMLLNFVSLFLIMGIGADDVFVMFDTYQQSAANLDKDATSFQKWKWTYVEAGGAMLITTVTTCGSFFSNMFSSVKVVREFGIFMGFVVVFNFLNVMIIFPSSMVIYQHSCGKLKLFKFILKLCKPKGATKISPTTTGNRTPLKRKRSLKRARTTKMVGHGSIDVKSLHFVERCFHTRYSPLIKKGRFFIVAFSVMFAAFSGLAGINSVTPSSGPPTVFLEEHNLGRIDRMRRTTFAATGDEHYKLAFDTFYPYEVKTETTCPGFTLEKGVGCSGNGACDELLKTCACNGNYRGAACDLNKTEPSLNIEKLPPTNIDFVLIEADPVLKNSSQYVIENNGDKDMTVSLQMKKVNWISSVTPNALTSNSPEVLFPESPLAIIIKGKEYDINGTSTTLRKKHDLRIEVGISWQKLYANDFSDTASLYLFAPTGVKQYETKISFKYYAAPTIKATDVVFYYYGTLTPIAMNSLNEAVVSYDNHTIQLDVKKSSLMESIWYENNGVNFSNFGTSSTFSPNIDYKINNVNENGTEIKIYVSRRKKGVEMKNSITFTFYRKWAVEPGPPSIKFFSSLSRGSITIQLTHDGYDGGAKVTGFKCVASQARFLNTYTAIALKNELEGIIAQGSSSKDTVSIDGLNSGKKYYVFCYTSNSAGFNSITGVTSNIDILANNIPVTIHGAPKIVKIDQKTLAVNYLNYSIGGARIVAITCTSSVNKAPFTSTSYRNGAERDIRSFNTFNIYGLDLLTYNYSYTCIVKDENGYSSLPSLSSNTIIVGAPDPPLITNLQSQRSGITVYVQAQGSVTVLGYKCTIDNYNYNSTYVTPYYLEKEIATTSNTGDILFTNLINGVEYEVKCMTKNSGGYGAQSKVSKDVPRGIPGVMVSLPNVTDAKYYLRFVGGGYQRHFASAKAHVVIPLNDDGGSPILYVKCQTALGKEFTTFDTLIDSTAYVHVNLETLDVGINHTVRCTCANKFGEAAYGNFSRAFIVYSPADKVENLALKRYGSRSLLATFNEPLKTGGYPVDIYNCTIKSNDRVYSSYDKSLTNTSTFVLFKNLMIGHLYYVTCHAVSDKTGMGLETGSPLNKLVVAAMPAMGPTIKYRQVNTGTLHVTGFNSSELDINKRGGLPIISYTCETYNSTTTKSETNSDLSFNFNNLDLTKRYQFRCKYATDVGESPWGSSVSPPMYPHYKPTETPSINTVNRLDNGAAIYIRPINSPGNGGIPIRNCSCQTSCNSISCPNPSIKGYSIASSPYNVNITGLENKVGYKFICKCMNDLGENEVESAESRTVVPTDPPVADPLQVTGTAVRGKITLAISYPQDYDYGRAGQLNFYYCQLSVNESGVVQEEFRIDKSQGNAQVMEFTSVSDGVVYKGRCRGESDDGSSDWNYPHLYLIPSGPPDEPRSLSVYTEKGAIVITAIQKPIKNNGAPVLQYTCKAILISSGQVIQTRQQTANSQEQLSNDLILEGLDNGIAYNVSCEATNNAGSGPASGPEGPFISYGIPDRPTIAKVTRGGSKKLIVTFSQPSDTGGKSISNYTCRVFNTTFVESKTVLHSPAIFSNLLNGILYKITCYCSNIIGKSLESTEETGIPATHPAPMIMKESYVEQISLSDLRVKLDAVIGHDNTGGTTITKFYCRMSIHDPAKDSVKIISLTGTDLTLDVPKQPGFGVNTTASLNCSAENEVGKGPTSNIITVKLEQQPPAPVVTIEPYDSKVYVTAYTDHISKRYPITEHTCTLYTGTSYIQKTNDLGIFEFDATNGNLYKANCAVRNALGAGISSMDSFSVRPGKIMLTMFEYEDDTNAVSDRFLVRDKIAEAFNAEGVNPKVQKENIYVTSVAKIGSKKRVASFHRILSTASEYDTASIQIKNVLPSSTHFKDSNLKFIKDPTLIEETFTRSSLQTLGIKNVEPTLAGFDPILFDYTVRVDADVRNVEIAYTFPPASETSLSRTIEFSQDGITYKTSPKFDLVDKFEPVATNFYVRIKAEDKIRYSIYNLHVIRVARNCTPACVHGTCNQDLGSCECISEDYFGKACQNYCPGVNNNCNGHGSCTVSPSGGNSYCRCIETYTGVDCTSRICPSCNITGVTATSISNGGCNTDTYECVCKIGYKGKYCGQRQCYKECHKQGICKEGTCECYEGYTGEFCDKKNDALVPLKYTLEATIIFGIDPNLKVFELEGEENNNMKYDKSTFFQSADAQNFLLSICEDTINGTEFNLLARKDYPCWISEFKSYVINQGLYFPVPTSMYNSLVASFLAVRANAKYKQDIGTAGAYYAGKVQWVSLTFRANIDKTSPAATLLPLYGEWAGFLDAINSKAIDDVGEGKMISKDFTRMDTEIGIMSSTITSYLASNLICLVCVLIFTGDFLISSYTMLTIILIVSTLLGFLFSIMKYTFGAIEAVGVTIFVGMSVDYALHMAHGYHGIHEKTRYGKVRGALTHLGVSILGGAITTAGAAIFLFFCHLYFFIQLGTMMFMNTTLALYFSLFFMPALLVIAGPMTHMFDIHYLFAVWKKFIYKKTCKPKRKKPKRSKTIRKVALPAKKKSDLDSIEDNQKLNAKSKEKELQKQRNQAKLKLEQRRKARAAKKNNQNK